MITTVIFDLSEVLLKGIQESGIALAKKYNIDCYSDPRSQSFSDSFPFPHPLLVPLIQEFFLGNISEDEYINEVIKIYSEIGSQAELKQYIRDHFIEIDGTRDIILKLKSLNFKLGLLSVHGKEWIEFCEKKFDFHQMFDVISYSYEDKVAKPNIQAFINIIERLGVQPNECLFIDDSSRNVQAAEGLGIQGLVFTSSRKLHIMLEQHLGRY